MVDVVKAARVGFGLQIDYLLRNAHAGHVGGYCRVAAFVALVRRPPLRCSTVKAETGVAIEMPEGAGEPDQGAGGITLRTVVHPSFIIAEADEAANDYGRLVVSSFGIEDDTCLCNVPRDLDEFLVVTRFDFAGLL